MSLFDQVLSNTVSSLTASQTPLVEAPIIAAPRHSVFKVESLPLSSAHGVISGKKGLFVNGSCVNIVSNKYRVHQPLEIYSTFERVVKSAGLEVNRVVTNPKNGGLLLSAHYKDVKFLGEEHKANLVFYTSHCGKVKTFLTLDFLRVSCFNQVPALYKNKQRHIISEKHYQNSLNISSFEKVLEGIPAQIESYNQKAELLQQKALSFDDFRSMYIEHKKLDESQKHFDFKMAELKGRYFHAKGQTHLAQNAYKAWQAITYENTHGGRNTEMKIENALIKGGNDSLVWLDNLLTA